MKAIELQHTVKYLIIACWMSCQITGLSAQPFHSALGLRGGTGAAASYKNFLGENVAMEGILGSFDFDHFGTAILFEKYNDTNLGNLQWFWGGGPYLNFVDNHTVFGLMGVIGLGVSSPDVPIEFSLDYTPRMRLAGGDFKMFWDTVSIGIRYVLSH